MPFPHTHPALALALSEKNFNEPTPVQSAILEVCSEQRDLLVSAQTGSGKTVAYGLAAADILLPEQAERFESAAAPLALIIAPTRELAMQVQREMGWLYEKTRARIISCIGGMDARREARALQSGSHIVVGTPGRLCDHLRRGHLDLSAIRLVVLDEADEMLDLGFREELENLLNATPAERRTFLFSATIAREIANLARRYQNDAIRINTVNKNAQHADIEHRAVVSAPHEAEHAIVNTLRYYDSPRTMVFCGTREMVRHTHGILLERGFASVALSGELGQNERSRAIEALRTGQVRVCVATDVAARGLDLPDLDLVIHANIPNDPAAFLHRSGRTGRAGRKGTCVLIVPVNQRRRAERLLAGAKVNATWEHPPGVEAIHARDAERLLADPCLSAQDMPEHTDLIERLTKTYTPSQLAQALIRIYHRNLPEPEEIRQVSSTAPAGGARYAEQRGSRYERNERPERSLPERRPAREPRESRPRTPGAWFNISVGQKDGADPKWIVPTLCRLGGIKKRDIGPIRISADSTSFEISTEAEEKFRKCVAAMDHDELRITDAAGPSRELPHNKKSAPKKSGHRKGPSPAAARTPSGKPATRGHKEARDFTTSKPPRKSASSRKRSNG